jgi:PleD family two-component response regulator
MAPAKTKILIVESFQANIELITQELEKGLTHYIFEVARTKNDFQKKLLTYKPDLILSNNIFTSFDGLSLFKIKKKLVPQTPFIFVSYPAREEHMIEFLKNGLTGFVLKDNLSSLSVIIKRVLQEIEMNKRNDDSNQKEHFRIQEL